MASRRGNGVEGTLSTPERRNISSTISALLVTSGRQLGIVISACMPLSLTWKPNPSSNVVACLIGVSTPVKRKVSLQGKLITLLAGGVEPSRVRLEASPPQYSKMSCVASSAPGIAKAGSTPRSKRYRASLEIPNLRPV